MKKNILICCIFLLCLPFKSLANSFWLESIEEAKKKSKLLNKPILIWSYVANKECSRLEIDIWDKKEIKDLMVNFIPVKIDYSFNSNMVKKYGDYRSIMIIDSYDEVLYRLKREMVLFGDGGITRHEAARLLKRYSLDLSEINKARANLVKDVNNVDVNLNVAKAYQDQLMFLITSQKKTFISIINYFLNKASKNIEKDNFINIEKIKLMRLLNKAYFNGQKRVLKILNREFKNVDSSNKALYYYLKLYCYYNDGNKTDATESYDKLVNLENSSNYLKNANIILDKG